MYPFLHNPSHTARQYHRPAPLFSALPSYSTAVPSFQGDLGYSYDPSLDTLDQDSYTDDEELLLRSALERKRSERLARQQHYRQQQQRQLEQQHYEAILNQERERQRQQARQLALARAHAQAQVKAQAQAQIQFEYEVEQRQRRQQEAIQQVKRAHWIQQQREEQERRQQQAAVFVIRDLQQQEKQRDQEAAARSCGRAYVRFAPAAVADHQNDTDEDPLSDLLNALFSPQQKRAKQQAESYPCKKRSQCNPVQHKGLVERLAFSPNEAGQAQAQKQQQQEHRPLPKNPLTATTTPREQEELYAAALPTILAFVEAIFGNEDASSEETHPTSTAAGGSTAACRKAAAHTATATAPTSTVPSSSSAASSPELTATSVLRQRQQRQQQQALDLQQKHSELNLIESALDSFSRDLAMALADTQEGGAATESSKKVVLAAEESVSKTMFQIDSVESEGDLSVRQRRKELIKKSQEMLDQVDLFKTRETTTGKGVIRAESITSTTATSTSESLDADSEEVPASVVDEEDDGAAVVEDLDEQATSADVEQRLDNKSQGEDDNIEAVEPYNVELSMASAAVSPETVQDLDQDDNEYGAPKETKAVEQDHLHGNETSLSTASESVQAATDPEEPATELATGTDSTHDDYDLVHDF